MSQGIDNAGQDRSVSSRHPKSSISRRKFLRVSSLTAIGLALPAGVITGCKSSDSRIPAESAKLPELSKGKSLVAEVQSRDALDGVAKVNEQVLKQMLEQGVRAAMGAGSSKDAWHHLFSDKDIVGIKFNGLQSQRLRTNPPMTRALVASLMDAGFKPENIVLIEAEPGSVDVRTRPALTGVGGKQVDFGSGRDNFKKYLTEQTTALINVPLLRDHNIAGVSIGLKNLAYGTIAHPWDFHDHNCDPYITDINALPVIKNKLKLTICNALRAVFENGPDASPLWTWNQGALLVSTDPVSLDAVGLSIIADKRKAKGRPPLERVGRPPTYIRTASRQGMGQGDLSQIEWVKSEV